MNFGYHLNANRCQTYFLIAFLSALCYFYFTDTGGVLAAEYHSLCGFSFSELQFEALTRR